MDQDKCDALKDKLMSQPAPHTVPIKRFFDGNDDDASIGCNPLSCTRPIQIGEDARAGRWSGSDKIECGINVDKNSLDSAQI